MRVAVSYLDRWQVSRPPIQLILCA